MKTLWNRNKNTIQANLSALLASIFTIYGTIEPEVLRECKLKIREMSYELMDPLVTIYNKIEELDYLGHTAFNVYSMS